MISLSPQVAMHSICRSFLVSKYKLISSCSISPSLPSIIFQQRESKSEKDHLPSSSLPTSPRSTTGHPTPLLNGDSRRASLTTANNNGGGSLLGGGGAGGFAGLGLSPKKTGMVVLFLLGLFTVGRWIMRECFGDRVPWRRSNSCGNRPFDLV